MIAAGRRYDEAVRIGARIRAMREHKGWSQAELGRRMGRSRQIVNKIEQGAVDTTSGMLRAVATALETSMEELVKDTSGSAEDDEDIFVIDDLPWSAVQASVEHSRLVLSINLAHVSFRTMRHKAIREVN